MTYETIRLERDGAVAVIRLSRPERMNAVIEQMYLDLQDALRVQAGVVGNLDGQRAECAFVSGPEQLHHSSLQPHAAAGWLCSAA